MAKDTSRASNGGGESTVQVFEKLLNKEVRGGMRFWRRASGAGPAIVGP